MGRKLPEADFDALPFGNDPWRLVAEGPAARLGHLPALFSIGNGFIGRRGPGGAADEAAIYLNGVYETVPIAYHEGAHGYPHESDTRVSVADATGIEILVDGKPLTAPNRVELDLRRGRLVETTLMDGVEVTIDRLVSMERGGVVAARVTFRSLDGLHRVEARAFISPPAGPPASGDGIYDPRVGPALGATPWIEEMRSEDGRVDRLRRSGFAVAALVSRPQEPMELAPGASISLDSFSAYAATRNGNPLPAARTALGAADVAGFDTLAAEQAAWFEKWWDQAWFAFPDALRAEQAMRHALFQLVQAAGRDGATSIAAKGQTGEGYEGHVFWDADLYVLPVFVVTQPAIARAMLQWRIAGLEAARGNARAMGQERGALYPWRTIAGGECSSFFPAGSAQYHINADVAYALRLYVETTGDRSILAEGGAEMLVETARIWLEIGFHDAACGGAFVINRVTGPDEYSAVIDNNLYTNMMAAEHLRYAAMIGSEAGLADAGEVERMVRAADAMLLPIDDARQIYAQDDGFFAKEPWPFDATPDDHYPLLLHYHPLAIFRHQVAKQADAILATVLLRDAFEPAMRTRMLDIYEGVTVHDSTLSASVFANAASGVGDAARAFAYWRVSLLTDLADLFGNSDHGLHMAALAGSWTALTQGFGGMRTTDGLSFAPAAIPALGRYAFRARYRDGVVDISVGASSVCYSLISGKAVDFTHHGEALMLERDRPVERELTA